MTIDQAIRLSDEEILIFLKKDWNISEELVIQVWGMIRREDSNYKLINVKTFNGMFIDYPIDKIEDWASMLIIGIPISTTNTPISEYYKQGERYISCQLILESKETRKKLNNPFALKVNPVSIELLNEFPSIDIIKDQDNKIMMKKSVIAHYIAKNQETINIEIEKLKTEKSDLENKLLNEEEKFNEENQKLNESLIGLNKDISEKQETDNRLTLDLQEIKNDINLKQNDISTLMLEIAQLREDQKKEKELMSEKLEKLRDFIKEKANTLLDLEFIDESEYNNLLMIREESEDDEKFVDFSKDLDGDKQKVISHIQAYLFEQGIIYPRYILEDFFALIQTNDLIVLAGESGSGKTNLIKSFAKAIGGKSFIIPVKPNWTSSEDLLGYYNPLEKKYLSTPFLEALLEAKDNPDIPYFICLDEMNLARIEYYFADFLSLLEERGEQPEIKLYSEDESSHILSEFKNVMDTIEYTKEKYKKKNIVNFVKLLQDEEINRELTRIFGFSDKDSLIKYHTDLRRMLSGILNTPSSIVFPKNVRIIGAINIDETTHYLSPKILDRAHIMKFDSPLLQDWDAIAKEIEDVENKDLKIKINIEDLGTREAYPSFDRKDEFCIAITNMTKAYFSPLGVEVGLRTIRQGLNYQKIFIEQGSNKELVMNNFIIHKILPKMTFDGKKKVREITKNNLLLQFKENLKKYIDQDLAKSQSIDAIDELEEIIKISESNDGIVNYWA